MISTDGAEGLADVVARLRRALRRGVRVGVPQESLSVAQVEVLQLLAETPGLRTGGVGERLRLAPTTVSTLVGQLLEKDAVERRTDPADGRAWILQLTPLGTALLARWQDTNAGVLREALARLPDRERRAIDRALPALDRLIEFLGDQ